MMRRFFAIAASAAALVATPVFGGEWEMELDIDRVTEFHTLEIVNATCVIGWNGDSLYLAVGKDGRFLHQGWFMQNGQTPPGVPSVRGNPIAAFRMSGCASRIIDIESDVVRCQWMILAIGPAQVREVHYQQFGCTHEK